MSRTRIEMGFSRCDFRCSRILFPQSIFQPGLVLSYSQSGLVGHLTQALISPVVVNANLESIVRRISHRNAWTVESSSKALQYCYMEYTRESLMIIVEMSLDVHG